ncbi:MurR/RpiR family transcriptional regulator, partial [Collinsella aerofaciens]
SKLATMADAVLGVAASEPLVRSGAMASRMAQLMVVDALYAAYVASDYERATHVIKQNYIEKQER